MAYDSVIDSLNALASGYKTIRSVSKTEVHTDLAEDEVHIWQFDLEQPQTNRQQCFSVLSVEERQRADRFATHKLKDRFVSCRGQLRLLLAEYLSTAPEEITFVLGGHGKPRLAGTEPDKGLVFNVSHSQDSALLAISRDRVIGADLEVWRVLNNVENLVERLFVASEKSYWYSLTESERAQGFFRIWTCKESFVKAVGKGIGVGMQNCSVGTGSAFEFTVIPREFGNPCRWKLEEIQLNDGFSAAVAVKDPNCKLLNYGLYEKTFR